MKRKNKDHGNTKTYKVVKSVLFSNALAFTDVIPLFCKMISIPPTPLHVISVLFTLSTPSHMQPVLVPQSICAPTQQVIATTARRKKRNLIILILQF
jgi:hypothetical protein